MLLPRQASVPQGRLNRAPSAPPSIMGRSRSEHPSRHSTRRAMFRCLLVWHNEAYVSVCVCVCVCVCDATRRSCPVSGGRRQSEMRDAPPGTEYIHNGNGLLSQFHQSTTFLLFAYFFRMDSARDLNIAEFSCCPISEIVL